MGADVRLMRLGQGDGESRSAFRAVLHDGGAAVQLDEVFDDGQAKADAARVGSRLVDPVEAFEQSGMVLQRNALSVIDDGQSCLPVG